MRYLLQIGMLVQLVKPIEHIKDHQQQSHQSGEDQQQQDGIHLVPHGFLSLLTHERLGLELRAQLLDIRRQYLRDA